MKQFFTFLTLLLSSVLFAQNYAPFNPGDAYHYKRTIGSKDYMFSAKINFSEEQGSDSVFVSYLQANILPSQLPNFQLFGMCAGTESWIGAQVIKSPGSLVHFKTIYGDSIHLKTDAVLNENWDFFKLNFTQRFRATVTNVYEDDVLGSTDSIKEITLQLLDNTNAPVAHNFNGLKILLSKNHGLVQSYNFYQFPLETGTFNLVGMNSSGVIPLLKEDIYKYEPGDYLVYQRNPTYLEYLLVTDKITNTGSIEYHFKKIIRNGGYYAYVPDYVQTVTFTPGEFRMMGEYNYPGDMMEAFGGVIINYTENQQKYLENYWMEMFFDPCWSWEPSYGTMKKTVFTEGTGLLSFQSSEWFESFDEWGNPMTETFNFQYTLNYFRNSDLEYGAYDSPFRQLMIETDKTESCDGLISFSLPEAGIDSVLWHFGDGMDSDLENAQHQYASAGNYNFSVDIYSDFGDTLLLSANPVFVGNNDSDLNTDPVKMLTANCNEFTFRDNTPLTTDRNWAFPDGQTSSDSIVSYTFDDLGTYTVHLNNALGYCTDNDSLVITVRALDEPIPANCPLQSPSYSLFGFELDDVAIDGSYYWQVIESPTYDGFMNGCNRFELEAGEEVNLRLYVGYYELVDVGGGNYDPLYTGYQFNVWIDYNNDGGFDVSEEVVSGICGTGLDVGAYNLYGYGPFTVPENAVRNVPLRMRLGANSEYNACQGELYDFSVLIQDPLGVKEQPKLSKATVFPNPGKGDFVLNLNNAQTVSQLDVKILDVSGQEVLKVNQKNVNSYASTSLKLDKLQSGVYFAEISIDGKHTQTIKLVKE